MRSLTRVLAMSAAVLAISTGCTVGTATNADTTVTSASRSAVTTTATAAPQLAADVAPALKGEVIFVDPGHAGSTAGSSVQVPTGRGGTKDCQTSGTSTDAGYPEHTFNWQIAQLVKTQLEALGATVVMSRPDDVSAGPCVDARATAANAAGADAVLSIHADGAGAAGHGFHVNYSAPPLNDTQAQQGARFATVMRDALRNAGLTPSTYLGKDGLLGRDDLTGLNLAQRPSILVELGNMRNTDDARLMTTADGRSAFAAALTNGVLNYLTA